jgi:threonine dehydrogenase-like Zn-dependent dehydrogenase
MMNVRNAESQMPALVFEMNLAKLAKSKLRGLINPSGYWKPGGAVGLQMVPKPDLIADDWVIVKTVYCGICGSDMKEVTLHGAMDNPLQGFLSFPQIMGHEIVGIVDRAGSKATRARAGDRVAISPWLPCGPRGITPECPRCRKGDYTHCHNFQKGRLPAGMHLGVTRGFGGFAPYVAVHESQCFALPDGVSFEAAVLADPFSVAFHSCLLLDPSPASTILVYGLGVIGLATVQCLKNLFGVECVLAVGRYPFQKDIAVKSGAVHVFDSRGEKLVEDVAAYTGAELYTPEHGSKWAVDGVDGIVDTVGSAQTLEAGLRFLTSKGRLVFTGVDTPKRCENTPHYFKELEIVGSNSFSVEQWQGRTAHAFEFFLDFLAQGKIDPAVLLTHKFPLDQYGPAFDLLADKNAAGAVKVVFDFT